MPQSVVIDDLDLGRTHLRPTEADAKLIVDPDRMLSGPVLSERMQPVARRCPQVIESSGGVDLTEFATRRDQDRRRHSLGMSAVEDGFRCIVRKAMDRHRMSHPVRNMYH